MFVKAQGKKLMLTDGLDIPVWSGECGDKIREVFGVSLPS